MKTLPSLAVGKNIKRKVFPLKKLDEQEDISVKCQPPTCQQMLCYIVNKFEQVLGGAEGGEGAK